jgi:hypothetical protein
MGRFLGAGCSAEHSAIVHSQSTFLIQSSPVPDLHVERRCKESFHAPHLEFEVIRFDRCYGGTGFGGLGLWNGGRTYG